MFAISAINDTDSKSPWEPLAPTKEAQEFHLTQTYHDGLLKLQSKEYKKARELLEAVVKDPLVSTTQVESTASDGHLLQLKFLALKNLATVFLQQGPAHYESALHCYLQAVEIDTKDSVVWNQLGTLACSMGLLSISRWAFEQGLVCSPNNWNCMEKLLEVLIAIGDEVASFTVAELILRHWPSHARAFHVKKTIEESEPVPFAPRGIDKLEPEHARLKFIDKRKSSNSDVDVDSVPKRLNQTIELQLRELSWTALADIVLGILLSHDRCNIETVVEKPNWPGNMRVAICLPSKLEDAEMSTISSAENISNSECYTRDESNISRKEVHDSEEQIHERRSTRLVSLRSQKTGKEDAEFSGNKDMEKVVIHSLQPFIVSRQEIKDFSYSSSHSLDNEWQDVQNFVMQTSKSYGAYQLGHLLLEEVAKKGLVHRDAFMKFLELEKLTRLWGCERTPECSLFLAELYHDLGSCSHDASSMTELMHEASFHLSKIIESVASESPMDLAIDWGKGCSKVGEITEVGSKSSASCSERLKSSLDAYILTEKSSFWVRFYWLSGLVSIWEGNRTRAHEEFSVSLSLLENYRNLNDIPGSIQLPHCKVNKKLTTNKIRHEINLLEVQFLLKNDVAEMLKKEMYSECIDLLAPLLLPTKGVNVEAALVADQDEGVTTGELSALDVLIKACEKVDPLNVEVCLNCQKRKLQILMVTAGMEDCVVSCELFCEKSTPKVMSTFGTELNDTSGWNYFDSIAEQVKSISECSSRVKNYIDQHKDLNDINIPRSNIADIQILLLALMCNIARMCFGKKPAGVSTSDHREQKQRCFFVNAAIAFCKLQHLDLSIPIKTQVDLITAIHDVLAKFGLCCVGEDGIGVDGTFLKLAIKHLLAMKIKSSHHSMSKESKGFNDDAKVSADRPSTGPESGELFAPDSISSVESEQGESLEDRSTNTLSNQQEMNKQVSRAESELAEDEREELESAIDNALNQCFYCLYGLNLRSDTAFEDDLAVHRNTSQADYQSKEQCADVFKYILPYAKASTKTGLLKLRRVLRAIRKHFPQPPDVVLDENPIARYLDDPNVCEDKFSEEAGSDGFLDSVVKVTGILNQNKILVGSCEPYMDVYRDLYYLSALSEETSATDKWPGFVLTKEGEDYVEQSANLSKYDLLFNPLRFESWQRLANIYDEEVDLLLNDGSKNINVTGWRKNASLPRRVESSRRRSRRCLLMSLALAKTSEQQSEIHEMLALVYYDGLQNVVPFYDQRGVAPSKDSTWLMFCKNSKKHFEKAFAYRQDWSHAFYLGKLCQKLGCPSELSLSYYDKAIVINPSAVDAIYRMHASRLKLLYTCRKQNLEDLKVFAAYSFNQSTKEIVMDILDKVEKPEFPEVDRKGHILSDTDDRKHGIHQLDEVWRMLYKDCLSALEICVEGDLKHFHKARYMLAQGLYRRGEIGDLQKARDEISFCFKSSRSSFTINMWEIDSSAKKGRRKAPAVAGSKKALEVNLPESSRKFITCIRKYLLFYLKLLEETGDVCTLDRAYVSIRADKRFSLCLEDLAPVALGRFIKTLISSMSSANDAASTAARSSPEQILEKMFTLFMEQTSVWPDICNSPEIKCPELSESTLYGYLHQYVYSLEKDVKLEFLEGINEKIRKRCRNPKLSNSNCSGVFKHASVAWCRSLVINLIMITPLHSSVPGEAIADSENEQLLCLDLQTNDFWNPLFGNPAHLAILQTKWNMLLSKVENVIVKKTSEENLETANSLLRSTYSFYRDSSSMVLLDGVNLFWVPARLITTGKFNLSTEGVEIVDVSVPRKLLMWAYTLLHGRCPGISAVVKYCEENMKTKTKRANAAFSSASTAGMPTIPTAQSVVGGCKDGVTSHGGIAPLSGLQSLPEAGEAPATNTAPPNDGQKILSTSQKLHHCNNNINNTTVPERRTFDLNNDAEPERIENF
ncbi:calcineurin-binding protein 1 isoform X2 [Beta vulgaris subsp. vulgaris]|uniref:calcineurin-binding protein 1 isoform X2 n=1 Tax=Beta vulgaris subsp. vulgaris TaxID=3555 RepID=UPI002547C323|nr:calcineurin-binding protein 1 isoform X2 [Beta vulgaris subsp. vulgaris]